jgi:DNA repair ATPase RecN
VKIYDGSEILFDVSYRDFDDAFYLGRKLQSVIMELNELHEENEDRFNEQMYLQKQLHNTQKELEPIRKICKKYRIPIKDLPEILEEYIAYDNDDEW